MNWQISVIKSAMQNLAAGTACGSIETLGLQIGDVRLTTGSTPWMASDRNVVTRTLEALQFGTMDALSLPRFEVPAEFVAGAIAMFVHPSNLMVACRWLEVGQLSADVIGNPSSSSNVVQISASQLFSLVLQLSNDNVILNCRQQFESRTRLAINEAIKGEDNASKSSSRLSQV